jgi:hypothetical protein
MAAHCSIGACERQGIAVDPRHASVESRERRRRDKLGRVFEADFLM